MKEEIQRTKIRQLQDKINALINNRDFWKCSAKHWRKAFYAANAENDSLRKEVESLTDDRSYWMESAAYWQKATHRNVDRLFECRQAQIDALSASE